jgi:hypothetical protein
MLHGRTVDAIARANTAILMQLLEWLIEQDVLERAAARDLLEKASQIWKTDLIQRFYVGCGA